MAVCRVSIRSATVRPHMHVFVPCRPQSSISHSNPREGNAHNQPEKVDTTKSSGRRAQEDGLWRLKTGALLRNVLLGLVFSSPRLLRLGTGFLDRMSRSNSWILNPDKNILLRIFVRPIIYDQFCAGANKTQIEATRKRIIEIGCTGIILAYGKEMQAGVNLDSSIETTDTSQAELQHWTNGNLETLNMMGPQDFLAIKFTGAGSAIIESMRRNEDAPAVFLAAMDEICQKAAAQGCRLWIDSEYQAIQTSIDRWTIDLMRKYNTEKALVYNTLQAYLKDSRIKLQDWLRLASSESWHLGIKLVRGAYIEHDERSKIHDTRSETDESYNSIVRDLLSGSRHNLGLHQNAFPGLRLFLAGHNPESIAMAWELTHQLEQQQRLQVVPEFGQLQGMGDQVSCRLLQRAETLAKEQSRTGGTCSVPKIYKYSPWGSVQECMLYLLRRAHENSSGTDRIKDGVVAYKKELRRRFWV